MRRFFSLPNRVSRLYPVFTLILLLSNATFFYAWQTASLELENLPKAIERNETLESQVQQLTAESKLDKAAIQVQKQKISDTAAQLAALEGQLGKRSQELASKNKQIENQQEQLTQNAAELERLRDRPPLFSFQNTSSLPDVASKQEAVKAVINSAYEYIQELYGRPYLLSGITITFVDDFSISGSAGEIVIKNSKQGITIDIHLKDFNQNSFQDVNTIIHEVIHGFHGVAVFDASALEEGMTVAAADAVMSRMIADKKITQFSQLYLNSSESQYQLWNTQLEIPSDNQAFYNLANVGKVYQLIGMAWYKLYQEDAEFFKKFNDAYYPLIQQGQEAGNTLVRQTIRKVISQVKGENIDTFLSENRAFHPR